GPATQTTPATTSQIPSPSELATREAQVGRVNGSGPTLPAGQPNPATQSSCPTPTPPPCATRAPSIGGSATSSAATTAPPAQTTPSAAYPSTGQPTLSPAEQATLQARMESANPGGPTTPAQAPSPLCPTPTPVK